MEKAKHRVMIKHGSGITQRIARDLRDRPSRLCLSRRCAAPHSAGRWPDGALGWRQANCRAVEGPWASTRMIERAGLTPSIKAADTAKGVVEDADEPISAGGDVTLPDRCVILLRRGDQGLRES